MESQSPAVPLVAFVAPSGTGKTQLLERVVAALSRHGLRLGIIKASHHDFEIDRPGKDSYRLHHAGARQTLLASPWREARITEGDGHTEPELAECYRRLDLDRLDLVLAEGWRAADCDKIEVYRRNAGAEPFLYRRDPRVIALAGDHPLATDLPCLPLDDVEPLVAFLLAHLRRAGVAAGGGPESDSSPITPGEPS